MSTVMLKSLLVKILFFFAFFSEIGPTGLQCMVRGDSVGPGKLNAVVTVRNRKRKSTNSPRPVVSASSKRVGGNSLQPVAPVGLVPASRVPPGQLPVGETVPPPCREGAACANRILVHAIPVAVHISQHFHSPPPLRSASPRIVNLHRHTLPAMSRAGNASLVLKPAPVRRPLGTTRATSTRNRHLPASDPRNASFHRSGKHETAMPEEAGGPDDIYSLGQAERLGIVGPSGRLLGNSMGTEETSIGALPHVEGDFQPQPPRLMEPPRFPESQIIQPFDITIFPVLVCVELTYCDNGKGICKCASGACHCIPVALWPVNFPRPSPPVDEPPLDQPMSFGRQSMNSGREFDVTSGVGSPGSEVEPAGGRRNMVPTVLTSPKAPPVPTRPPAPQVVYQDELKGVDGKYVHLSDPANPGVNWCWELRLPVQRPRNWGWLVDYSKCNDKASLFHQRIYSDDTCTTEGGMEVTADMTDTKRPYKIACVEREWSMKSTAESCWVLLDSNHFGMKLKRVDQEVCNPSRLSKPFQDKLHISSRFNSRQGGMNTLYHCNGPYSEATAPYHYADHIYAGYDHIICHPTPPEATKSCEAIGMRCLNFMADPFGVPA